MPQDNSTLTPRATTPVLSSDHPVNTTRVAGYVVVSRYVGRNRPHDSDYQRRAHLNEAADLYTDYEDGEYRDWIAVGIFPCDERGMPIDKPLDPHTLTRLVRETRAA